jgi:hypothetical protein
MSVVRFSKASDLYVYFTGEPNEVMHVHCCGCLLRRMDAECCTTITLEGIQAHLMLHRQAGHIVPVNFDEMFKRELEMITSFDESNPTSEANRRLIRRRNRR